MFYDKFYSKNIETLTAALAHRRSVGDLATLSQQHITPLRVMLPPRSLISSPADCWSSSSTSLNVGACRPPSRALLRSPPPFEYPLGKFPLMCRIHRVKPHRKRCPVARTMPGSGEPPPRLRRATTHEPRPWTQFMGPWIYSTDF
jgi:hypothetical protein